MTNVIESDLAIIGRELDPRNRDKLVRVHHRVQPTIWNGYLAYIVDGVTFYASANDGHAVWVCEALGQPFIQRDGGTDYGGTDYKRRFMPIADWRLKAIRYTSGEDEAKRIARVRGDMIVCEYRAGREPMTSRITVTRRAQGGATK